LEWSALYRQLPNLPWEDVPEGGEEQNIVLREVGERPKLAFEPKTHVELGEKLGLIDKERAARVAGSRFTYLLGDLVKLQFGIIQFVLAQLTDEEVLAGIIEENSLQNVSAKSFIPVLPPYMLRTDLYDAMDRLEPREERYKIETDDLWLQGSAEHVLGPMHAGEALELEDLPVRYLGYATSFRREAGAYGKDLPGIVRLHQFDKLEMESFVSPENGYSEHLFFIAVQEYLMQELGLPYRVVLKSTAEIGKPNARGVDIEAWLPGQNKFLETHTADFMTDYQARRLQTKAQGPGGSVLVHTNDATAFALGRILVAILESYQQADGSIKVPGVLHPYLDFTEIRR
jgi:seryl-tRNA synthetase